MATLMDVLMQQQQRMGSGGADFTLGGRRDLMQQPYSDQGRLGAMGMRNMMAAQERPGPMPTPQAGNPFMSSQPMGPAQRFRDPYFQPGDYTAAPPARDPYFQPGDYGGTPAPIMASDPAPQPRAPAYVQPPLPAVSPMPPPRPQAPAMPRMDYQSNNQPVQMQPQGPTPGGYPMPQTVNWGDPDSAADFFRASEMLKRFPGLLGG